MVKRTNSVPNRASTPNITNERGRITGPSVAQLPRENGHHHEAHEEHEGRKHFLRIRCPLRCSIFVSFATFLVLKSFVEWRVPDDRRPKILRKRRDLSTPVTQVSCRASPRRA